MRYVKKGPALIAAVLLVGILLRVWGLDFGLPFQLHNDEPIIVNHAVAYGTGDLNPHFFIIPPLCSYLLFMCYGVYFVTGEMAGLFAGTGDFALQFFSDPTAFYLIARILLGLVPGTLAIWIVYLLYKKFFSGKGASYAAAVVALSFLPVVNSHYAYVDNMMVLFVLLTYLSLANMIRRPSLRNYLLSGALLGLATGTKYNAALLVFSFIAAHFIIVYNGEGKVRTGRFWARAVFDKYLWGAGIFSLVVFMITSPYSVLDWRFFVYKGLFKIRSKGAILSDIPLDWYLHHIRYSLWEGISPGLVTAGLAGGIIILLREKLLKKIFFLSFPLLFYLHLAAASQRFSRYGLPLVPFFAIAAAFFLYGILYNVEKTRAWKTLVVILSVILLVPTVAKTVKADLLFGGTDTRVVSARWIEKNVPEGSRIAVDHTSYRPVICQTPEQLRQKYSLTDAQQGLEGAKRKKLRYMADVAENRKTYDVYFLAPPGGEKPLFLSMEPRIDHDVRVLEREGIDYVVINYNTPVDAGGTFMKDLHHGFKEAARFSPYIDGVIREPYDREDYTYMSIGSRELFSRRSTGPGLVIYKIKSKK